MCSQQTHLFVFNWKAQRRKQLVAAKTPQLNYNAREHFKSAVKKQYKRQQVEQNALPPPSIPFCRKRRIGIENMCDRVPTGSGKIGAVGKVDTMHAFSSKRW